MQKTAYLPGIKYGPDNIENNNYYKLRDITNALDCRVEWDEKTQTIWVIPARTAFDDPDEIVG